MTLADEILAALPQMLAQRSEGPMAADVARHLVCGVEHARTAMQGLNEAGRALLVRYPGSKARHLAPVGHDFGPGKGACPVCGLVFDQPRKKARVNCSRTCAVTASWRSPETAKARRCGIGAAKQTPEARAKSSEANHRRWADPAQRERLAQLNREYWADPGNRLRKSASIQAVNGSPEKRAEASRLKREAWQDPEKRARMIDGAKRTREANR